MILVRQGALGQTLQRVKMSLLLGVTVVPVVALGRGTLSFLRHSVPNSRQIQTTLIFRFLCNCTFTPTFILNLLCTYPVFISLLH